MSIINELSSVLINLIRLGVIFRIIYCCIHIAINEDDSKQYKKRIKNILSIYVFVESIFQIKDLIIGYFG